MLLKSHQIYNESISYAINHESFSRIKAGLLRLTGF